MSLQSLKIEQAPAAFAELAAKHNALVEILSKMRGVSGLEVMITADDIVINGAGGNALEARIAALETTTATLDTLTSGLSRQSVSYCSGTSATTKTILMS